MDIISKQEDNMGLTALQEKILAAPENKIAVQAAAASIKTGTLIEKTRRLLYSGVDPESIAVITFTRMAAQQCVERLGNDYRAGMFIGTIHALAAKFISRYGMGDNISKIAEEEEFDKLFSLCEKLPIRKSYSWLLIDEFQDTGIKELNFIFDLIQPDNYFIALDWNQSIYKFRDARPDLAKEYIENDATFYSLNENYRNDKKILQFAKRIIRHNGIEDNSICMSPSEGIVEQISFSYDNLTSYLRRKQLKDWAILCRTNNDIAYISRILDFNNIDYVTFKQGDVSKTQLEDLMNSNKVKVLTIHSSKGLAWDNVMVYNARWWNDEEVRLNYVAATRARHHLIWFTKKEDRSISILSILN